VRIPIAVSLALVGAGGYAAIDGWHTALAVVASVPFELASAYSLSVVPLFILMGAVASRAQMSRELFDAANAVFSGFRGALASATVGACAAFGAICGSSIATAATFSKVAIPEMRRHGYNDIVAAGSVAAAGTLGILIPPSVILAVYSLVAEQSLAKLFAAALFPGILLAALYVVAVVVQARLRPEWMPRVPPMPLRERLRAARGMWKLVLLFFFAVGAVLAAAAATAGSRGVLVALLGAALLGGVLLIAHSRRPVLTFVLIAAIGLGVAEAGRQFVSSTALTRYQRLTSDPRRDYLSTRALDQALAHPLGNGIGRFGLNLPVINPRPKVPYPHNVALEVFNESGIFALGALAGRVAAAFLSALRVARLPGAAFCAVGLAFALLEAFASFSATDMSLLWLMLGIALAMPGSPAASDA